MLKTLKMVFRGKQTSYLRRWCLRLSTVWSRLTSWRSSRRWSMSHCRTQLLMPRKKLNFTRESWLVIRRSVASSLTRNVKQIKSNRYKPSGKTTVLFQLEEALSVLTLAVWLPEITRILLKSEVLKINSSPPSWIPPIINPCSLLENLFLRGTRVFTVTRGLVRQGN
jgi:hypothetical protein